MENGRQWLGSWTADRNQWKEHMNIVCARQNTSLSVGGASCARSQTFSDVWEFDTKPYMKLGCTEYLNTCNQTMSDVCTVINLKYKL